MDPVSHVVMGRALVAALERSTGSRFGPGVGAAAIAGALVPDIDSLLMPAGWDVYLRAHQAGTHSVLGACALGGAVGIVARGLVRFARSRTGRPGAPATLPESAAIDGVPAIVSVGSHPRVSRLAAAATLAALSHLLLDALSGAPLGLAWPLSRARLTLPLVAMAEPWLVALFVIGAVALWRRRTSMRRSAIFVVLAVAVFFGAKTALFLRVLQAIAADPRLDSTAPRAIEARWGTWTDWNVFEKDADAVRAWRVSARTGTTAAMLSWPAAPESPLVTASRSLDTVRNFLSVHALGFATERRHDKGRIEVLWSDVRYCWMDQPVTTSIQCGLWFGGVFDQDGQPITQLVHVGWWIQARSPPR